jgi:hypothetical protein
MDTFEQRKTSTLEAGQGNQFYQTGTYSEQSETPIGIMDMGERVSPILVKRNSRNAPG